VIDILISQPWNNGYAKYNPEKNGNYANAYGGGKKTSDRAFSGFKEYTHRHPFNIITEEIYDSPDE
jgi:hypothetical protein